MHATSTATEAIKAKDKKHFLHPWQHFDSMREEGALVISKAEGAYVYDTDGNRYLDGIIHHISAPDVYRRPEGMSVEAFCDQLVEEFEAKVKELGSEHVAAFLAEPILGSGGVMIPPPGYLQRIHKRCRELDIIYISDEVVTAFGRIGHMFASYDEFGVQPDIILCAKGITSGYIPLGATLFSDKIFEVINAPDPDACFAHGFTYSGHPVACAVALKNIEIMEREKLCEHVQQMGQYFGERLQSLVDLPLVGNVRGQGFMYCIEYVADKESKELLADEIGISKRIADNCEKQGVIVRPVWHLNILSPPLIMNKEEIDHLVSVLRQSVLTVAKDLEGNY